MVSASVRCEPDAVHETCEVILAGPRSVDATILTGQSGLVSVLASVEVVPIHAQVCLLEATWQDYPQWESGDEAVAFKSPSLVDPDRPPYPGFAVATRSDLSDGHASQVLVELHAEVTARHHQGSHERPRGRRCRRRDGQLEWVSRSSSWLPVDGRSRSGSMPTIRPASAGSSSWSDLNALTAIVGSQRARVGGVADQLTAEEGLHRVDGAAVGDGGVRHRVDEADQQGEDHRLGLDPIVGCDLAGVHADVDEVVDEPVAPASPDERSPTQLGGAADVARNGAEEAGQAGVGKVELVGDVEHGVDPPTKASASATVASKRAYTVVCTSS